MTVDDAISTLEIAAGYLTPEEQRKLWQSVTFLMLEMALRCNGHTLEPNGSDTYERLKVARERS